MGELWRGDCRAFLAQRPDDSVDSIVTDPPYELGFMGKAWDSSGIAYDVEMWRECLRVLKPGGHLLAFGGSRTYHRLACAIEDAGFEIRDQIMWVYGSGFPKSLDVAKAIDKAAGVEFEASPAQGVGFMNPEGDGGYNTTINQLTRKGETTPEAAEWEGWGTALKPAHEPIVMARKPIVSTVAENVLKYRTGAINIDASRIGTSGGTKDIPTGEGTKTNDVYGVFGACETTEVEGLGRWPSNFIHDGSDEVLDLFPTTKSGSRAEGVRKGMGFYGARGDGGPAIFGDEGSASRFFYCAKPSRTERDGGLEGFPQREAGIKNDSGRGFSEADAYAKVMRANFHPTVKPLDLMRYLVRLVTPRGGVVFDPFLGSGSTAVAATLEYFEWVGCELTEDYWQLIEARADWADAQPKSFFSLPEFQL